MTDIIATFQEIMVTKAWIEDGTLYREGWISTNHQDREREITEPEAFAPVLDSYFARGAPVSSTHDTKSYPVGHLQKGALLRDGKVFREATHPTDPAEFTSLPETGDGFFGRLAINDPIAANQVAKGNVGGCSFIASVGKAERLPGGGRRFTEFKDLIETTIAAYPINPRAVLTIAKAYGLSPDEKEPPEMTEDQIKALIADALKQSAPPAEPVIAQKAATVEELTESVMKAMDARLAEQFERNGVGRVGQAAPVADPRDSDPVAYLVKKASSGEALADEDRLMIAELTLAALTEGMHN